MFCKFESYKATPIPREEFDETAAIAYMIDFLTAKTELSPGNPFGFTTWTLHEVGELRISQDEQSGLFWARYTVTHVAPEMGDIGGVVVNEDGTSTHTQQFSIPFIQEEAEGES